MSLYGVSRHFCRVTLRRRALLEAITKTSCRTVGFEFIVRDAPIGQRTRSCLGSSQLPGTRDSMRIDEGGGENPKELL
jgi:hypothetical protein